MTWLEIVLPHLRKFEGFRDTAYRDSAGIWTIGYGATLGVEPGDTVTREQAEKRLLADVMSHAMPGFEMVDVPLSEHEKAALASFIYNVGIGAFTRSTLRRKLNAGDRRGAADEFMKWVYAGGKPLRGLKRRRKAERTMFRTPDEGGPWQQFFAAVWPTTWRA